MNQIIDKISKLLALGERGGTEAEATAAMQKVHELLAKHNLSLDDVKDAPVAEEDYVRDETESASRQPWQDWVWTGIAELYFCQHFKRKFAGDTSHLLIGKPSNIAVVKFVATYVIRTGDELARKTASTSSSSQAFRNSFKKGFAIRIVARTKEEIRAEGWGDEGQRHGHRIDFVPALRPVEARHRAVHHGTGNETTPALQPGFGRRSRGLPGREGSSQLGFASRCGRWPESRRRNWPRVSGPLQQSGGARTAPPTN